MFPLSFICLYATLTAFVVAYSSLSDDTLRSLPVSGSDFDIRTGALLAPLLRPRVPGTDGILAVQHHFVDFFRNNLPKWNIEFHNSTSTTPLSNGQEVPFVNIILTRDPPWAQIGDVGRLALVAHYDSKLSPEGFIGAIDSAAPCAMLMHTARSIDAALTKKWEQMEANGDHLDSLDGDKGVQIILLDGEEAFVSWTDTDSLYGARALAQDWEQGYQASASSYHNPLASIHLFLLLDLLGSKAPTIPSYFQTTHWAYQAMGELESKLRKLQQFKSSPNYHFNSAEKVRAQEDVWLIEVDKTDDRFMGWMIQDDHVPFMERGVEVLHMIPSPFPSVWHTADDDAEHLDGPTVEDWATLITAFTAEWMELEGFFDMKTTFSAPMGSDGVKKNHEREDHSVLDKSEL